MEGVSEEEEVDDQLLWNLQILSEVYIFLLFPSLLTLLCSHLGYCTIALARNDLMISQNICFTLGHSVDRVCLRLLKLYFGEHFPAEQSFHTSCQ